MKAKMIILNRLQGGFAGVEALVATLTGDCRRPGGHLEVHVAQVWNHETCQDDLTKINLVKFSFTILVKIENVNTSVKIIN
jgi:hypothetical protein